MEKVINFLKEEIRIVACLSIILLIIFVNIARVNADYMDEETNGNKKEQQLLDKIEIIKDVFPNQIDEYALYATLMHRGTLTDYIEESYDENFDKDEYNDLISDFAKDIGGIFGKVQANVMSIFDYLSSIIECALCAITGDEEKDAKCELDFENCVIEGMIQAYVDRVNENSEDSFVTVNDIKKPQTIDLLMAATIVMLDSSGWTGNYSDENYKKALAGEQLVGNMFDQNNVVYKAISVIMNGMFCAVGQAGGFDLVVDWLDPSSDYGSSEYFGIDSNEVKGKYSRFFTMSQICQHGYIGGTYEHVKNPDLSTEEGKEDYQGKKDIVAEQIIDLAKRFRGEGGSLSDICITGNTQASDLSDMTPAKCAEMFGPAIQADYSRTGIFASVTLGQAWFEAHCGEQVPPGSNNIFGIKCGTWEGECSVANTSEFENGGYINISAGFRVYPSIEAGIEDHSAVLLQDRYVNAGVLDAKNYKEQVYALVRGGYATEPSYAETLIAIIEENGFDKWDVKVNTTSSLDNCAPVGNSGWTIRTVAPTKSDQAFVQSTNAAQNTGQCVWYARGRALEIVEELRSKGKLSDDEASKISNLLMRAYGNGGEIYDNAKSVFNGSSDIRQPKAGSYIVWKKPGSWGHVGIVEDVTDTTITLTEGWSTGGGSLSCNSDWSCVTFDGPNTYELEDFYNNYGAHRDGSYVFSGYVYFLEPLN